jgi:hypothetical protein
MTHNDRRVLKNKIILAAIILLFFAAGVKIVNITKSRPLSVTFNANGASGTVLPVQKAAAGSVVILPGADDLSKSDHTFGGWNTEADGTGAAYIAGSSISPNGNIALYAQWVVVEYVPSPPQGSATQTTQSANLAQAIRLDPNYASAYNDRGNAYRHKGDYARAIADYTQAISLNPNYASAYNNRGNAYQSKGDTARANADFAMAKELRQ